MRRRVAKKHLILPDPRFDSVLVTSFVNNLMLDGKKSVAFDIFYKAMDRVQERTEENSLEVFQRALDNVTPGVEVRSRRVGGATFQIPQPIRDSRKLSLAMKWLISFARKRNEKSMAERLSAEVIAAAKEEGATFKKKEDTHRMAEANKAFSHFRF
jgi:small subunit ribosomal protein S7|tara:strand:+ start:100 stop:567 length:468 start_codon:yes stop_codon:yes gene_type:complete